MSDNTALKDKKPRKPYLTLLFTVYALCYGVLLVFLTVQLTVASGVVAAFLPLCSISVFSDWCSAVWLVWLQ